MTGAPFEIERKFLVAALPPLGDYEAHDVRQGYVTAPADSIEMRVRQRGDSHYLTIKSGDGIRRAETEIGMDAAQFAAIWPLTAGRRIEKTRHIGRLPGGLVLELDVFSGSLAPLTLVEVEFATLEGARAFVPPDWFGADVTDDKRYKNKALAIHGAPVTE